MDKSYVGMFQCFFCMEDVGIVLHKRMREVFKRRVGVVDMNPCQKCKDYMEQGIILISIKDDTSSEQMQGPIPNPFRTGCWAVIKEEAFIRMVDEETGDFGRKNRFMFITDMAWNEMGLPKENIGGENGK